MGDRLAVPLDLHDAGGALVTDGGVATLTISNDRTAAVTITAVEPVADPGLIVKYLGHTDCHHGCIGTGFWDDPSTQRIVHQGLEGQYPVAVSPDNQGNARPEHFVFLLRVAPAAMQQLRSGCLWLRQLRVTLSDGHRILIDGYGNRTILGVFADDHALPGSVHYGPHRCPLEPLPSPAS